MNIDITSRGFTPSSDLVELINSKLLKLDTFDKNISNIKVVLLKESRAEKVELIVQSKKKYLYFKMLFVSFWKDNGKSYRQY